MGVVACRVEDADADPPVCKDVGVPHLRGEATSGRRVRVVLWEAEASIEEPSLAEWWVCMVVSFQAGMLEGLRNSLEGVLGPNDGHLPLEYVAIIH